MLALARIARFRVERRASRLFSNSNPNFLSGSSSNYIDSQYEAWKKDPNSVHPSWASYFATGDFATPPPADVSAGAHSAHSDVYNPPDAPEEYQKHMQLLQMIRNFQVRGHYAANLDPLGIYEVDEKFQDPEQFELGSFFSEADRNMTFNLGNDKKLLSGFVSPDEDHRSMTLGDIYDRLKQTYCGNIGFEYMHLPSREECSFIRDRIETVRQHEFTKEERLIILDRLMWAHSIEDFLALKWAGQKRFGLNGLESFIPGMKAVVDTAADLGVDSVVLGMPHRGRLNVLATVMRKPLEAIFTEFHGLKSAEEAGFYGTGDVKYHLGTSVDRTTARGKKVRMSLVANPSHLEAENTVVLGKTRAKLDYRGDSTGDSCLSVLIHGDAAFAAQGIAYETMILTDLPDYTTGGVVHMVANNQIGFTTDPQYARSSPYCTDLAKTVGAPIFHVNADDPEAVVRACRLAMEFRQKFKKDVVIDLVGYRRFGHNEADEPRFTQPKMYAAIDKHPNSLEIYSKRLIDEGHVTAEEVKAVQDRVNGILHEDFEKSKNYVAKDSEWLDSNWEGFFSSKTLSDARNTGVSEDVLKKVGQTLSTFPSDFTLHPRLKRVLKQRQQMCETGQNIDWGTAEALAFGSLLLEGYHVRLSGQDVQRGTFSHRHAVVHDQLQFDPPKMSYCNLENLPDKTGRFTVVNSPLSEFGVLGYEYGYSLESPMGLVLWEAQFGDFANGAQTIFDQFISSAEFKWLRQSGLVVLLPHAFEGGGPEHSSGRIERFLQMCAEHPDVMPEDPDLVIQKCNWQIVNCSTPANYFHVLRRQVHRNFRKPLVVFSPKSLLKLRECTSTFEDMEEGSRFQTLIPERRPEALTNPDKVRRVILCTGHVYFDLLAERQKRGIDDVAIVTIEQLSPFPFREVQDQLSVEYPKADVMWVQEEPMNMGAWSYVRPRIATSLRDTRGLTAVYAGRVTSASPATGFGSATHKAQIQKFLDDAFSG